MSDHRYSTVRWPRRAWAMPCILATFCLVWAGCTQAIELTESTPKAPSSATPTPIHATNPPATIPPNAAPLTLSITSPEDGGVVEDDSVTIVGRADDDGGLASVFVQIGRNTPVPATSDDGFRTWRLSGHVPWGDFDVRAWAFDIDGIRSEQDAVIHLSRRGHTSDALAPIVEILSPDDNSSPLHPAVVLEGTTSDDRGVVRMEIEVNGEIVADRPFTTSDQFQHWSRLVALIPGTENILRVRAYDALGNSGSALLHLNARPANDREPPSLTVHNPTAGATINAAQLTVQGGATDNLGVREVKARVTAEIQGNCDDVNWSPYVQSTTKDGYAHFSASIAVHSGPLCLEVTAIDVSGLRTRTQLHLTNAFIPTWSDDISYLMRLHPQEHKPSVHLELTKQGLKDTMTEQIQKDLIIAKLDLKPVLYATLNRIKSACGICWKGRQPTAAEGNYHCSGVADYDCTRTDLGCSFGTGPSCTGWQSSPEYALVRLLTMTPANGDIEGSSLGQMQAVVDAIRTFSFGLLDSFADIISSALDIDKNTPYVTTDAVAAALEDDLIASHPSFVYEDGKYLLPIRLYDALRDLQPLTQVLGPASNGHPGVADPSFPVHGVVFPDNSFRMVLDAKSNLRWHDGLQLGTGKDYLASIVDNVGPTYDDVLEFDFYDPARFKIIGLPHEPTVDMRFTMHETPRNIEVCSDSNNCQSNGPHNPFSGYAWALDPWTLEHILIHSAYLTYTNPPLNTYTKYSFIVTLAEVFVGDAEGRKSNPPGWMDMNVSGIAQVMTGAPPPPQYIWGSIMSIAEVVGHRNIRPDKPNPPCPDLPETDYDESQNTICEGDLNPSFTLYDVPTGVTAQTLEEDSRDQMHAQRKILTQRLLGGFEQNNGCVDVYYVQKNGTDMLWQTTADDPLPNGCHVASHGGFYSDEDLTDKVSTTSIAGVDDSTHQKWATSPGTHVLYMRGSDGNIWRLTVTVPQEPAPNDEITVQIAHKL